MEVFVWFFLLKVKVLFFVNVVVEFVDFYVINEEFEDYVFFVVGGIDDVDVEFNWVFFNEYCVGNFGDVWFGF